MAARIYPKRPPKVFVAEWRESKGLTQEQLGARLGVRGVTVSRWETDARTPDLNVLAAICEALGIDISAIYHHPDRPSADDLLRDQPPEVVENALKMIRAIRR
jgi:transcriptional regulator with XRE-family HTH domain